MNDKIIERVVWSIARKLPMDGRFDVDDLMQEGRIAFEEISKKFDSTIGTKFETFIRYRLRGAVLDYVRRVTKSRRSGLAHESSLDRFVESNPQCDMVDANVKNPLNSLIDAEQEKRASAALRLRLSVYRRFVLDLVSHGWKSTQIAKFIGVTEGAISTLISHCTLIVKENLRMATMLTKEVESREKRMEMIDQFVGGLFPDERMELLRRLTSAECKELLDRRDSLRADLAHVEGMIEATHRAEFRPRKDVVLSGSEIGTASKNTAKNPSYEKVKWLLYTKQKKHEEFDGMRANEIFANASDSGTTKANLTAWLYNAVKRGMMVNTHGKFRLSDIELEKMGLISADGRVR